MSVAQVDMPQSRVEELEALLAHLRVELTATSEKLTATSEKLAAVESERDNLRRAYRQLMEQFELLRRRIFIAKAERVDATQLELEFEKTKQKLDELARKLTSEAETDDGSAGKGEKPVAFAGQEEIGSRPVGKPPAKPKARPKGRRNLAERDDMPERRVEIRDETLEKDGADAPVVEQDGERFTLVTAPLPPLIIRRGLLAPSMLAHVIVQKFRFGMPYFRQEEQLEADGIELDRGTMARSVEEVGACLGAVVLAMADDARQNAFCLSTDATGVAIRPEPLADGRRQPCKKGNFFVVLADKKHVFFEYQPKHTSAAVCEMFRGFSGYIQADAHVIYDALFRGEAVDDGCDAPTEVGCWSHARRRFWEAAVSGFPIGREGLLRIRKLYQLDQGWTQLPPATRLEKRRTVLLPFVDEFFDWVRAQNDLTAEDGRGPAAQRAPARPCP